MCHGQEWLETMGAPNGMTMACAASPCRTNPIWPLFSTGLVPRPTVCPPLQGFASTQPPISKENAVSSSLKLRRSVKTVGRGASPVNGDIPTY